MNAGDALRPPSQSVRRPNGDGPFLIVAAFWSDHDITDEVAEAVSHRRFPEPDGWPRGAVVAFRREVATSHHFRQTLRLLDLLELTDTPTLARLGDDGASFEVGS